ncbi:MAG TPA: dienelactone hydrolase family protein [Acetobacteraceae bacterium]|nr:dienelactone hydrolase family protein [Acetobacteraceae bacterium]
MGGMIELKAADGHMLSAYKAGPADAAMGLVVVQEIFGVNAHMRHMCEVFAAAGIATVAPALFDRAERGVDLGYGPDDIARGRDLRGKVTDAAAMADIEAAAGALGGKKLGIVGYCWGGTIAWWGATRSRRFAAAAGWYGGGIAATRTETPHCPVQLHFGETDGSIPLSDVEAIRAAHPDVPVFVYPGAGHGFGCEDRPSFDPRAFGIAQSRTMAFFGKHLA